MAEYIEHEAAIQCRPEALNENRDDPTLALAAHWWNEAVGQYVDNLQSIPAADVRPVVRGAWIVKTDADGKTYGVCSECGYKQYAGHLKFCPNCGAVMEADNEKA